MWATKGEIIEFVERAKKHATSQSLGLLTMSSELVLDLYQKFRSGVVLFYNACNLVPLLLSATWFLYCSVFEIGEAGAF